MTKGKHLKAELAGRQGVNIVFERTSKGKVSNFMTWVRVEGKQQQSPAFGGFHITVGLHHDGHKLQPIEYWNM